MVKTICVSDEVNATLKYIKLIKNYKNINLCILYILSIYKKDNLSEDEKAQLDKIITENKLNIENGKDNKD